ncbi:MAG: rhodanese-like domain-containing protein [Anaerolineae bacterium]|nr:rhodanese-like domain-containing protein [Anaerolineae bacterium]
MGYERRFNDALLQPSREHFVDYMQDDQPLKPANILNIVATNQGKRPLTAAPPRAKPLSAKQVAQLQADGHYIVDCRSSAEFGAGHIAGSINVQLSSSEFEQRVGWMVPDDAPIVLVTGKDADAQRAIYNMAFIALDSQVTGFLKGGMDAWMEAGKPLATVPQIDVHTLKHKLSTNGLQVLDVRDSEEWDEGHIDGAHFMPYTSMVQQLTNPPQLDKLAIRTDQSVAVTCATGKRSSTAISILKRSGYHSVYNVTGGMKAWEDAGFEMLDETGCVVCKVAS